jgi:hypothetical protein
MEKIRLVLSNLLMAMVLMPLLTGSNPYARDAYERTRGFTRSIEFDYVTWMLDALMLKNAQTALDAPRYLNDTQQGRVVEQYIALVRQIDELSNKIEEIYTDPDISDPAEKSADLLVKQKELNLQRSKLGTLAESVFQQQVGAVLVDMGLSAAGQPIPSVLYRVTPLPLALIVSPRRVIKQDANISLQAGMTLDEIVRLEKSVEKSQDVSALVVEIGGVGVYPTMIMSTTDLNWLAEVVSHEWTHNYLTLRPLGVNYETSPELRTMNETTAAIAGREIGREIIRRFYPARLPPEPTPAPTRQPGLPTLTPTTKPTARPGPPPFSFQTAMHDTRVQADKLLSEGRITEAEDYMEERRKYIWENGYQIRRLNQAYFAFNGAYADTPGGAAGRDPVGPAVRALRQQCGSLAEFINRISWMVSFETLKRSVPQ